MRLKLGALVLPVNVGKSEAPIQEEWYDQTLDNRATMNKDCTGSDTKRLCCIIMEQIDMFT